MMSEWSKGKTSYEERRHWSNITINKAYHKNGRYTMCKQWRNEPYYPLEKWGDYAEFPRLHIIKGE